MGSKSKTNDKKYFFYKTTYTKDNRYYYGVHHGTEDDGYYGSNKIIKSIRNKHGNKYLIREILKYFDNKKDMFAFEDRFLKYYNICSDKNSMNFTNNGCGGDTYSCLTDEEKYIRNKLLRQKNSGENHIRFGKTNEEYYGEERAKIIKNQMIETKTGSSVHTGEYLIKLSNKMKKEYDNGTRDRYLITRFSWSWKGKNFSKEHKKNIGIGVKNSEKYKLGILKASETKHKKYLARLTEAKKMMDAGSGVEELMIYFNIKECTACKYRRDIKKLL
ncbi:MAG: hypothetical protein H8E98_03000 [Bacteroidetes bacterium]|nr:hypothetical protein [Bacteroidota bacterium]